MSTAPATSEDADAVAAALRDAPFVRIVAAADGDALAASGVLARALEERSTPFQIRIDAIPDPATAARTADDLVVGIGPGARGGDLTVAGVDRPASLVVAEAIRDLGLDPDPMLALAGVASAGRPIDAGAASALLEAAGRRTTVDRRPGVAVPTADLADGLAHSTLVHAPFSGDAEAARAALAGLDLPAEPTTAARRRLASWVAIRATDAASASARAVDAVERVLRPYATPDGRLATVAGFGDVLDAVARERPGTGVAFAIRSAGRTAAIEAWRDHARAVHDAVRTAETTRHDGILLGRADESDPARLATIARLRRDFRSPEPVVLVVAADGTAAAAASVAAVDADLGRAMQEAVAAVDSAGTSAGGADRASARFDDGDETGATVSRFTTAFEEAL
jgi:hypothetical protein